MKKLFMTMLLAVAMVMPTNIKAEEQDYNIGYSLIRGELTLALNTKGTGMPGGGAIHVKFPDGNTTVSREDVRLFLSGKEVPLEEHPAVMVTIYDNAVHLYVGAHVDGSDYAEGTLFEIKLGYITKDCTSSEAIIESKIQNAGVPSEDEAIKYEKTLTLEGVCPEPTPEEWEPEGGYPTDPDTGDEWEKEAEKEKDKETEDKEEIPMTPLEPATPVEEDKEEDIPLTPIVPAEPVVPEDNPEDKDEEKEVEKEETPEKETVVKPNKPSEPITDDSDDVKEEEVETPKEEVKKPTQAPKEPVEKEEASSVTTEPVKEDVLPPTGMSTHLTAVATLMIALGAIILTIKDKK